MVNPYTQRLIDRAIAHLKAERPISLDLFAALLEEGIDVEALKIEEVN